MTDNVEIAKLKMFKAEQVAVDLNNWFGSDYHTVKEMTDLLRNVAVDDKVASEWRFVLTGISRYGIEEFVKTYAKQASQLGLDRGIMAFVDDQNFRDPWLIEPLKNEFETIAESQYIKRLGSLDDLSILASTVVQDKSRYENRWSRYSRDQWIDWSRTKGNNCTVKGPVKTGKTDLSLSFGEMAREDGADIKTNIYLPNPRPGWTYTTRLSVLIKSICESKLKKKRVLFLMDEAGLFWARIDTILSVPKDLSKLVICLGKMETNLGFISHFDELVPTIIRRTSVASFEKRSLTSAFVEIKAGNFKMEPQLVTHIPRTSIEFDPDQLAFFNRDMFVADLLEFVSNLPAGENQWEKLIGYVNSHAGESDEVGDISPKQVALWIHKKKNKNKNQPQISIRQIADIVEIPKSTVSNWINEVKRELDSFGSDASVET